MDHFQICFEILALPNYLCFDLWAFKVFLLGRRIRTERAVKSNDLPFKVYFNSYKTIFVLNVPAQLLSGAK